jgi:hypothetical protein
MRRKLTIIVASSIFGASLLACMSGPAVTYEYDEQCVSLDRVTVLARSERAALREMKRIVTDSGGDTLLYGESGLLQPQIVEVDRLVAKQIAEAAAERAAALARGEVPRRTAAVIDGPIPTAKLLPPGQSRFGGAVLKCHT